MQKLKQQLLFDRVLDKLPDHVTLLLVILSGFLLARLTWMLFPADPSLMASVQETPVAEVEVIPAKANSGDLGKEIAGYHLLGVYQPPKAEPPPPPPAPVVAVVQAPPPPPPKPEIPRDPIKLVGVYALSGKAGVAVIDVKGQQQVFGIGEQIPGNGAILERVYDNRVELSWNGKRETLEMPKMETSAEGAVAVAEPEFVPEPEPVFDQPVLEQLLPQPIQSPDPAAQQQPGVPQTGMPQPGLPQPGLPLPGLPQTGMPQPTESGTTTGAGGGAPQPMTPGPGQQSGSAGGNVTLASFRQEVMANNIKLLEVLRPSPVKRDGQLTGFRVTPGRNRTLFQQTGLKAGDIVTEINGSPLNSDAASLQAMQGLANSGGAQLTVLRGGQLTSVQVSF